MKKKYLLLGLLIFPGLGFFLASYLEGYWSPGSGIQYCFFMFECIILIPLAVFIAWQITAKWIYKWLYRAPLIVLFIVLFIVLQIGSIFLFPPGATTTTMGLAHKLKKEYSTTTLRATAEQILSKHANGTLNSHIVPEDDKYSYGSATILVDQSELPEDLQNKFKFVAIIEADGSDPIEVRFVLGRNHGIVCNAKPREYGDSRYSIADGVHAYYYTRG